MSVIFGVIILVVFTAYLTQPIKKMVVTMEDIIRSNDLSQKVDVEYQDEIGTMAHTFNVMLEELGGAYAQIKNFALQSVLAKKSEQKVRNIFQKVRTGKCHQRNLCPPGNHAGGIKPTPSHPLFRYPLFHDNL
jgi:adenylate cyclase